MVRLLVTAALLTLAVQTAPAEAQDADRAAALYKSAVRHLTGGRWYARSVRLLEEAKALDPSKPQYREALGCAYLAHALDLLMLAQSQGAGSSKALLRSLVDKAIAEVNAAVQAEPTTAEYHHTLGWIHLVAAREGLAEDPAEQAEKAVERFREAVRLSPRSARYRRSLGDLYRLLPSVGTEEDDPALAQYRTAVQLAPNDAGLRYILSTYEAKKPGSEGLLAALEQIGFAARLDPTNAVPQYLRAELLFRLAADMDDQDRQNTCADAAEAVFAGNNLPELRLSLYAPAFPRCLAPVLSRLMQESGFDVDLALFERLKDVARRAVRYAQELEGAAELPRAVAVLENVIIMGERIAAESYPRGASGGRELVQFSAGLAIQQEALRPLTDIVMRHGTPQHAFLVQQKQQELAYLAELLRRSPLMEAAPAPSTTALSRP